MKKEVRDGLLLIAIAMLAVLLIGCVDTSDIDNSRYDFLKGRADVQLLTLEDGTQCAVLIGHRRGALDCNWK